FVAQHSKTVCKKSFLHLHKNFTAVGQQLIDLFCFPRRIKSGCKVNAAHRFGIWNISTPHNGASYLHHCVEDGFLPFFWKLVWWLLVSSHHHYFAGKMLLVKPECCFAMSGVVDINIKLYGMTGIHDPVWA